MTALLDALPLPAALVDGTGRVRAANALAGLPPGAAFAAAPGWSAHPVPDGVLWLRRAGEGAALAHDLGNLLAVAGAAAEAMGALPVPAQEAERQAILDAVRRGRAQLGALRGAAEAAEALELGAWLGRLAPLLGRMLGPGIELRVERPAVPLRVLAPAAALDRAVLNLAANARRAMGGRGRFALSLRGEGRLAVLEAADDGPGFSAAALAHGLQPGFSGVEGTGLGLPVVRAAAAAAGGEVVLGRAALGGALVRLALPLAPPAPALEALVVEDEAGIRRAVQAVLARAGHHALAFEDAESAIEHLEGGGAAGLLVTDLTLPGADGTALAAAARALRPGLPVLMMSGYGLDAAAGATHFLRKPFTAAELEAAISRTLSLANPG